MVLYFLFIDLCCVEIKRWYSCEQIHHCASCLVEHGVEYFRMDVARRVHEYTIYYVGVMVGDLNNQFLYNDCLPVDHFLSSSNFTGLLKWSIFYEICLAKSTDSDVYFVRFVTNNDEVCGCEISMDNFPLYEIVRHLYYLSDDACYLFLRK